MPKPLTAIIQSDTDGYTAFSPELDIASQGNTIVEARDNLREAVELFLDCAPPKEVDARMSGDTFVTLLDLRVRHAPRALRHDSLHTIHSTEIRYLRTETVPLFTPVKSGQETSRSRTPCVSQSGALTSVSNCSTSSCEIKSRRATSSMEYPASE